MSQVMAKLYMELTPERFLLRLATAMTSKRKIYHTILYRKDHAVKSIAIEIKKVYNNLSYV